MKQAQDATIQADGAVEKLTKSEIALAQVYAMPEFKALDAIMFNSFSNESFAL